MVTTGSAQQTDFSPDNGQQGPGHAFLPFLVMEDLLDKLKLLNYDIQFVADLKMRPLNRLVVVTVLINSQFNCRHPGTTLSCRPTLGSNSSCSAL